MAAPGDTTLYKIACVEGSHRQSTDWTACTGNAECSAIHESLAPDTQHAVCQVARAMQVIDLPIFDMCRSDPVAKRRERQ